MTQRRCDECGNTFRDAGGSTSTLDGRMICDRCEERAERDGAKETRSLEQSALGEYGDSGDDGSEST